MFSLEIYFFREEAVARQAVGQAESSQRSYCELEHVIPAEIEM